MKKAAAKAKGWIKVKNEDKAHSINEFFIKKITGQILKYINKECPELEIIFLSDKDIKGLNKRYKHNNTSTDVLSFEIDGAEFGRRNFSGEIFISPGTALRNSKIFGTSLEEEIVLYVIHGILHLFGYDDENSADKLRMSGKEKEVLDFLCRTENLRKVLMPR